MNEHTESVGPTVYVLRAKSMNKYNIRRPQYMNKV